MESKEENYITDKQKWTIKNIERNLNIKFDGITKSQATEFISKYIQKSYDEDKRKKGLLPPAGWEGWGNWGKLETPKFFPNQLVFICKKVTKSKEHFEWKHDHMGSYRDSYTTYYTEYIIERERFSLTLWEKYKGSIFSTKEECEEYRDEIEKKIKGR